MTVLCHRFVEINKYWDRISKCLICLVDAGLNWYFLRVVKQRLVEQYGLMKYAPLVDFNTRLMVLSVLLDVSLESFWLKYWTSLTWTCHSSRSCSSGSCPSPTRRASSYSTLWSTCPRFVSTSDFARESTSFLFLNL